MDIICWAFCSCRDRSTAGCQQRSPEGPSLGTIGSIAPLPCLDRRFRAHRWGSWALISKAQELKIRTLTAFMVNCCSRVAKRAMRAQKKKRGQSKLFFKIPRTLDWDGSATLRENTRPSSLQSKRTKLTRLNSWKSKRTKPHYLQTCTGFALSHDFLRTFCGDQLRDASSTLNTVRHLSSLLRRRLHQMTKGLNSAIICPAPARTLW